MRGAGTLVICTMHIFHADWGHGLRGHCLTCGEGKYKERGWVYMNSSYTVCTPNM